MSIGGGKMAKSATLELKEVNEPIVMLNHYLDFNNKTNLNTNLGYQFW